MSGADMPYTNFIQNNPDGQPYLHLDYDYGFAWGTKNDGNDKDNGFVCKRPVPAA
jgi:hypothetical protein